MDVEILQTNIYFNFNEVSMRPNILITNDDGIHAPGIRALWKELSTWCDVTVIAPAKEQSATGLSITIRDPIRLEKHRWDETEVFAITGTPADSVKMAISVLMDKKPDLIVSGINKGSNAGKNILYSGTVSAVIEGALRGVPGIAFSCFDFIDPDYTLATPHVSAIVRYAIENPLPEGTLLNVNFPEKKMAPYNGLKFCRQGKGYWIEKPDARSHPSEGHSYWWMGLQHALYDEHTESDISALATGWISAVPVYVSDLTNTALLAANKALFETYFTADALKS